MRSSAGGVSGGIRSQSGRYTSLISGVYRKVLPGGEIYLFVEAGGFGPDRPQGWKTDYHVLKRESK